MQVFVSHNSKSYPVVLTPLHTGVPVRVDLLVRCVYVFVYMCESVCVYV